MGNVRGLINRFRLRGDRGASGVEYALVISLVLTGSTASFEMMDERIEDHYEDAAQDIGQADLDHFDVTTTTCVACASTTTTTTTTTLPPATTTAAPTTTSTTTTSTTTTSTTTTTTTTTAPPAPTTTAPGSSTASADYTNFTFEDWNGWKAKVRIEFDDDDGDAITGAVFDVTWVTADGDTKTQSYTTNSYGKKSIAWSRRDAADFPITITITAIDDDGESFTLDPSTYSISQY